MAEANEPDTASNQKSDLREAYDIAGLLEARRIVLLPTKVGAEIKPGVLESLDRSANVGITYIHAIMADNQGRVFEMFMDLHPENGHVIRCTPEDLPIIAEYDKKYRAAKRPAGMTDIEAGEMPQP